MHHPVSEPLCIIVQVAPFGILMKRWRSFIEKSTVRFAFVLATFRDLDVLLVISRTCLWLHCAKSKYGLCWVLILVQMHVNGWSCQIPLTTWSLQVPHSGVIWPTVWQTLGSGPCLMDWDSWYKSMVWPCFGHKYLVYALMYVDDSSHTPRGSWAAWMSVSWRLWNSDRG